MTEKTKTMTHTIVDFALSAAIIITNIGDMETKSKVDDISEHLESLENGIQFSEKSRGENFEKRLQELSDKIAEIDRQFEEEIRHETYTEAIIFEEKVSESEPPSKERLPEGVDTNRYDCEPHTFGIGSDQYRLQTDCLTDEKGLRYFYQDGVKYYCVAMGGAYGIDLGDTWYVTLDCGTTFGIILSDYQHSTENVDPNDFGERYTYDIHGHVVDILRNYDGEPVVHVLEFVVDIDKIPDSVVQAGTVSALDEFGGLYGDGGNIVDISYNGRLWYGRYI